MSAIGPDDLVECVRRPGQLPSDRGAWPEVGGIYTVVAVQTYVEPDGEEVPCVHLSECIAFNSNGDELAWWIANFRPAGRRDESLIKDLLRPVDQPAERVTA